MSNGYRRTIVTTDAAGQAGFAVALETLLPRGQVVTATATGPDGSTSEFSQCVVSTDIMEASAFVETRAMMLVK